MLYGLEKRQGLRRSFIILPTVSLLSLVILSFALANLTRELTTSAAEQRLTQTNVFVMRAILHEAGYHEDLAAWDVDDYVRNIAGDSEIRITLVDMNGAVLADNKVDISTMDNHRDRPEIRSAIQGSPRFVTRYSSTLEYELMYHAVRFSLPDSYDADMVLRTAVPLVNLQRLIFLSYRLIALISGILIILSTIIIIFQLRAIRTPLNKIVRAAELIERNEWELDLYILRPYEMARIAQAMKSMARTLRDQISTLEERNEDLQRILNIQKDPVLVTDRYQNIVNCNKPAVRFLASQSGSFAETTESGDLDKVEQIMGKNLMTFIRSSELNEIFDRARESGDFQRGDFRIFIPRDQSLECYVTPFSGGEFETADEESELYLLVIYHL